MCGIAGVVLDRAFDPQSLRAALHAIRHRGPDNEGWLMWSASDATKVGRGDRVRFGGSTGFVHTRLAIIDPTAAGFQPMSSPSGRCHIVFNGEIYNYVELRDELRDAGVRFRTSSDTEVLLAAYETWGAQCVERFSGMFSFALLDERARTVLLARDRFGIKPLFVAEVPGGIAFASEIGALLALRAGPRVVHRQVLYDYLRWGITDHDDRTMIDGIHSFPAAHIGTISLDAPAAVSPQRYWQLQRRIEPVSLATAAAEVRARFTRSIELHLRSDVPVGAALSGGIDSTAIVTVARLVGGPNLDLHCFSYIADDPAINESRWIEMAAEVSGAVVHPIHVGPDQLAADLDALIAAQGEPFGSTSIWAQHVVYRAAREAGVPVLLDGQGADELFAGYRGYLAARFATLVRAGHLVKAARFARSVQRLPDVNLDPRIVARTAAKLLPGRLREGALRTADREPFPPWLDERWFGARGVEAAGHGQGASSLSDSLVEAFSSTILPSLLRYEDRNSMAHAVEGRVPFLENDLVDYVFTLPDELLISNDGQWKLVLREALRGIAPDAILDRRDKIGFSTPGATWLRSLAPWVEATLRNDGASRLPGLDTDVCRRQWEQMRAGSRRFDWSVWRWVNALRWAELLDVVPEA